VNPAGGRLPGTMMSPTITWAAVPPMENGWFEGFGTVPKVP
jgi:hypothetical protein